MLGLTDSDMSQEVENLQRYFQKFDKIKDFQAYPGKVHSIAWNKDGRRLASGSSDKVVNTFHLDNNSRLVRMCAYIMSLKFTNVLLTYFHYIFFSD